MNTHTTRLSMTTWTPTAFALCLGMLLTGCGPTFDPASLIETTRVLAARAEVAGSPGRASPAPGETVTITWLVTSADAPPPLTWAFAVCRPGNLSLDCDSAPLALFEGTDPTPQLSVVVPSVDALGTATSLVVYGQLCSGADSVPRFEPPLGLPACTHGGGTTASVAVPLQRGADANHNPVADRAFAFDGQAWPAATPGDDPCVTGPRVTAGSKDHVIGNTTAGSDRETYPALVGTPPVAVPARESLQISQFTTAGKLNSQFSFVETSDDDAAPAVTVNWEAPRAGDVPASGLAVTFTFVTRDNRGGTDWTTRRACVEP